MLKVIPNNTCHSWRTIVERLKFRRGGNLWKRGAAESDKRRIFGAGFHG
jgi:hypothetical protein